MEIKRTFLNAWQNGEDHDALLSIVHQQMNQGILPRQAYDVLQEIWLEHGYDEIESSDQAQDDLEYVMEKIWYECPAAESGNC